MLLILGDVSTWWIPALALLLKIEFLGKMRLVTSGLSSFLLPTLEEGPMIGLHCTSFRHPHLPKPGDPVLEGEAGSLLLTRQPLGGSDSGGARGRRGANSSRLDFGGSEAMGTTGRWLNENCKKFITSQKARGQLGFGEARGQAAVCTGGRLGTC